MATWGSTTIKILRGTYRPPHGEAGINEIKILPNPLDTSTPATVLQQSGRSRKRVSWQGYVSNLEDYNNLYDDFVAATQRTFTGFESETLNAIIEGISEPEYIQSNLIRFSITLVEA